VKLWKGNRVDAEYELSNKEVAEKFLKSKFAQKSDFTDRCFLDFLTSPDGLDSTWEFDEKKGSIDGSKDMLEILDIIDKVRA